MATRASIAILEADGKVHCIYSHWDGYLDGLGATLHESYTTPEKVRELLAMGDASVVGCTVKDCEFYSRDRGEDLNPPREYNSPQEWIDSEGQSYNYLFRDGGWMVTHSNANSFATIPAMLAKEMEEANE